MLMQSWINTCWDEVLVGYGPHPLLLVLDLSHRHVLNRLPSW